MPDLGQTRPSHSEKGGVWLKTDLQNGKNITQILLFRKTKLGERSNAQMRLANPSHNEKGGVRLKNFLPNERGTPTNPCRRGIFGFPDAKIRFAKVIFATEEKC